MLSERVIEDVGVEIARIELPALPTAERVQLAEDGEVVIVSASQCP